MISLLKDNIHKILFYVFSLLIFFAILFLMINFERISFNIFELYNYFNATPNPFYQLLLGLILFVFLTYFILLSDNQLYIYSWLIKAFVTIVVGGIFEYLYFGLDQYGYFTNAIYDYGKYPFFQSGTGFIIGVNSIFTFIGGNSFYSLKIINSFISFISLVLLYKTYIYIIKKEGIIDINDNLSYMIFIVPSVLLWSSLIGKDALILFPISLYIFAFVRILDEKKFRYILFLIISLFLAYYIRRWIPFIMISTIVLYNIRFNKRSLILLTISIPLLYFIVSIILKSLNVSSFDGLFQILGRVSQGFSRGNSALEVYPINSLFDYIIYFLPNSFITMFMPLPFFSTSNISLWFFSFENLLLLYLFFRFLLPNVKLIFTNKYLKFFLFFLFSWLLIYVILSPGNLATALRYKSQILPIFIILILLSKYISSSIGKNKLC